MKLEGSFFQIATLAAGLLLAGSAFSQDLSDFFDNNGSFELGTVPDDLFPPDPVDRPFLSSDVPGWVLARLGSSEPRWIDFPGAGQDGDRFLLLSSQGDTDFGASVAAVVNFTSVPPTFSHTPFTVGELYELSFFAAGGPGDDNGLLVELIFPEDPPIAEFFDIQNYTPPEFVSLPGLEWTRYSIQFVAPSETMNLGVLAVDNPANAGTVGNVVVDNFQLARIPEPGSALLILAAGGLTIFMRRRHLLAS